MKVSINLNDLSDSLAKLFKIVKTRSFQPNLEAIYFKKLTDDSILMIGSTHSVQGYSIVPARIDGENRDFIINAGILYELVKTIREEDTVVFEVKENYLNISTEGAKYKISISSVENQVYVDIPKNLPENYIVVPYTGISRIAQSVAFATHPEPSDVMNGVLLEIYTGNSNIVAAATDNFRLAVLEVGVSNIHSNLNKILVPRDIILKIAEFYKDEEVKIHFTERELICINKDKTFIFAARILVGEFPNYWEILPKDKKLEIKVKKEVLHRRLRAIAPLISEDTDKLILDISADKMKIGISNKYLGDAESIVPLEEKEGEDMKIAFSYKHLLDGVNAMKSDEIIFKFKGEKEVCTLEEDRFIYLLVPMVS